MTYEEIRYTFDSKRASVWGAIAKHLERWIPDSCVTLELAAGYCDLSNALHGRRRTAIDINPRLEQFASPEVRAVIGDATDLSSFAPKSFDVVLASNFLEHLPFDAVDSLLDRIHGILRPGGCLILIQPNFRLASRRYFDDFTHRTIFTDVSLCGRLESRGFQIEHTEARFLPLSMNSRLSFGHRLVPLYLRSPYRPLAGQMLVIASRPAI